MNPPHHIVHVITTLSSGGAEAMLYKLLKHSPNKQMLNYSVISLTGDGIYGPLLRDLNIPVHCLQLTRGIGAFRNSRRLYRLLKDQRPDLLQTWLYHSDFIGLILGKWLHVPNILWNVRCSYMNFDAYARTTSVIFHLLARLSRFPNTIITNSRAGKASHIQRGYHSNNWKVIPNGFDTQTFRPDPQARAQARAVLGLKASTRVIGMVARYDPMKDVHTFFAAARLLNRLYPDTCYVLAGRGLDQNNIELNTIVRDNDLEGKTYLLGERNDIETVFQMLDIHTLSSLGEGFPNVLGEAMACGIPCVATDVGDAAEIVGDTGRIVRPGEPQALADAWTELLDMPPEQFNALGIKARQRIKDRYSISRAVRAYEDLYVRLMNGRNTSTPISGDELS